jgi:hypothetical protein
MDFVSDALASGRRIGVLTVIDGTDDQPSEEKEEDGE